MDAGLKFLMHATKPAYRFIKIINRSIKVARVTVNFCKTWDLMDNARLATDIYVKV